MSHPFADAIVNAGTYKPREGEYLGEDGLWYCGKCGHPRQYVITEDCPIKGVTVAVNCLCMRREYEEMVRRRQRDQIDALREACFTDPAQRFWTFLNDNGTNPKMDIARRYCEKWETEILPNNYGLLLYGGVGCGKSYMAGCIANALIDRCVPVRMTSFTQIVNDLIGMTYGKNEYISRLCSASLLIIDDFGVERSTEYTMEQIYSVIDARSRSGKPLIITTNMDAKELTSPKDIMRSRIYDRILEMCCPVAFSGVNQRQANARRKFSRTI